MPTLAPPGIVAKYFRLKCKIGNNNSSQYLAMKTISVPLINNYRNCKALNLAKIVKNVIFL